MPTVNSLGFWDKHIGSCTPIVNLYFLSIVVTLLSSRKLALSKVVSPKLLAEPKLLIFPVISPVRLKKSLSGG